MGLDALMRERGLTAADLVEMTGISKRTIQSYRQGARGYGLGQGLRIADALGVDPHELLAGEREKPSEGDSGGPESV